ncbi:hypothetical protein BpHYR1_050829 [Brachionus plicatilis]|uniref:Uncharacterized protein n=1 Tax=Brachionus plicatilis TaxID=10195 RepID=A0A3M7PGH3_BRAPC|nr:hypothetical protein BpHYR1_050829 [Brachionus plicatilis]
MVSICVQKANLISLLPVPLAFFLEIAFVSRDFNNKLIINSSLRHFFQWILDHKICLLDESFVINEKNDEIFGILNMLNH